MPIPNLRLRRALMGAVAVGAVGVLSAVLLPTSASPRGDGAEETEFHVAGDGTLPETAPPLRAPHEPLSSAERGYAIHLARESMPAKTRDVLGMPGGEVLAADLPPLAERTSARLVTVAVYDYTSDRLHQMVLDLTNRKVLSDQSVPGLQLPPTMAETTVALDLAMRATKPPAFFAQYREITGNPLATPEQVHVVAGVWRAADETTASENATEICGRHRCLQLLLALPSGQYLDTQDFAVDLSGRTVLTTAPAEPEHDHDH